jgi:excisionase family DNA binding protein
MSSMAKRRRQKVGNDQLNSYPMSLDEVAKALGVSVYTIRRLVAGGSLPAVRIGSRVMVDSATVIRVQRDGIAKDTRA